MEGKKIGGPWSQLYRENQVSSRDSREDGLGDFDDDDDDEEPEKLRPRLIPCGNGTLRHFGYCLIHVEGKGTEGGRRNDYLVVRLKDAKKEFGEEPLGDIPQFYEIRYKRVRPGYVRFYQYQQSKSGRWEFIRKSQRPQKIRL